MRRIKQEKGQSAVELAFSLMLLIPIVFALIDFSYIFRQYIGVTNAANAGVAYGADGKNQALDTAGIQAAALGESTDIVCDSASGKPTVSAPSVSLSGTDWWIRVTVTCKVKGLLILRGLSPNINLSVSAERRVAQW
jgi:Flp pilus assembly protein TadG